MPPYIKAVTGIKGLTPAPFTEVISWGLDAAWPVNTPVQAVLMFTESADALATWLHGSGTSIGARALAGGTANQTRAWAGQSDGGAYSGGAAYMTSHNAWALAPGIAIFTGHGEASECRITAMGTNQFTVEWTTNTTTIPRVWHALVIGGIVDSYITGFTIESGPHEFSGLPWCADCLIAVSVIAAGDPGSAGGANMSIGVANHALEQWAVMWAAGDGGSPDRTLNARRAMDGVFGGLVDGNKVLRSSATLTSFTPSGLTYNGVGSSGFGTQVAFIALKGIASKIGKAAKPIAAGPVNQDFAVPSGLTSPGGILLASAQDIVQSAPTPHDRFGLGLWDGVSQWAGLHSGQDDHRSTYWSGWIYNFYAIGNTHGRSRDDACFVKCDNQGIGKQEMPDGQPETHTTPVEDAYAVGVSKDAAKVRISWTLNDPVATEMFYFIPGAGTYGACPVEGGIEDIEETVEFEVELDFEVDTPLGPLGPFGGGNIGVGPPIRVRPDGDPHQTPTTRRRSSYFNG